MGIDMKKFICSVALVILGLNVAAGEGSLPARPTVDKRVEIMSIVFRLAGKNEYTSQAYKNYTDRIESHFGALREHELIKYIRSRMYRQGLGYDAVMSMAVHLDSNLNLRSDITPDNLDSRWRRDSLTEFTSLLSKFRKDSHFDEFFAANESLYSEAVERFVPLFERLDLGWFKEFFGEESGGGFTIIIALGNGGNNYGASVAYRDGTKAAYALMGTWSVDAEGKPLYQDKGYFPILIHEFCHTFVNHLNVKYEELFREKGEKIFASVEAKMRQQAYGHWRIVLNEALVRASVIMYMREHNYPGEAIQNEINAQVARGFYWIDALADELERYSHERYIYPTLDSFMPELAEAYKGFP